MPASGPWSVVRQSFAALALLVMLALAGRAGMATHAPHKAVKKVVLEAAGQAIAEPPFRLSPEVRPRANRMASTSAIPAAEPVCTRC